MKQNKLIALTLAVLSMMALNGCQTDNEEKQHYDNKLFISASTHTQEVLFKSGDTGTETTLSVGISKPEGHDITATLETAPELLDTYKAAYYDETAILLPEEHYSMEEHTATIKAGAVTSNTVAVDFLNTGELDIASTYVLPVTITSVDGIDLLQSGKTYYYVFRGASLINVVCNLSKNCAYPDFNNDSRFNNLTENTMEILFKANAFPNTLHTLMGIEGKYLLRIGDAGIASNQLQVATSSGNFSSTDLQFDSGKWYHLAVTFNAGAIKVYVNGVEKASGSVSLRSVSIGQKHSDESNNQARCFWIGYSYSSDRYFDGVVSEARIWNRALTAEEIQATNHFYEVDPASDGLISYWKFDEGAGTTVKDSSPSGYNLTIQSEPEWVSVSLPEK